MVQVKFCQLIAAAGIVTVGVAGSAGIADASPTPSTSSVACVDGDGVLDLALTNPEFNGSDASVSTLISCDTPECASGVLSIVTDDNGVQHQACVDSAVAAPPVGPAASPARASVLSEPTPTASPSQLPKTGLGTGGLIIAAALVCSGCVASLVSRRKTSGRRQL